MINGRCGKRQAVFGLFSVSDQGNYDNLGELCRRAFGKDK